MQSSSARPLAPDQSGLRSEWAEPDTCCVVGSGPAGVACARALLDQGRRVRMLDAGLTLEPEKREMVERLRRSLPREWEPDDLTLYQAGMNAGVAGVPLKLVYGSDFAYRGAEEHFRARYEGVGLRPSLAQGGLSNVWGAAMLPFFPADIADWPLAPDALAAHYAAAIRLTGLTGEHDALEQFFPLHTSDPTKLRPSRQSQELLRTMTQNRSRLEAAHIQFGHSRLAVKGKSGTEEGCLYCRLCMYGCPYDYIYRSSHTLDLLQKNPNFIYQSGVIARSVRESAEGVEISGYDLKNRQALKWRCSQAFLAAGAIATTQILLRSLGAYDQTVWLKDSQYFLVPLMLLRKAAGAAQEDCHGLSQLFVELFGGSGEGVQAHIQIYSNSDLLTQAIASAFGPLRRPLGFVVRDLQERLMVAQGFLHSTNSARIAVRLKPDTVAGGDELELRAEPNPETSKRVRQMVFRLFKHSRQIGAVPLLPMLKIPEPGRSFHTGGSFPMSAEPRGFQTDILGRLPGWQRVHAVDATIFPSVPATTITLSVMANAHRIGCAAGSERGSANATRATALGSQ